MRKYRFSSEPRPQRPAEMLLEGIPEAMTTSSLFPPELETAITAALVKHREQLDQTACSEYECSCGFEPEPVETELWRGQEIGIVAEDWFEAHQAAVVKEVIAQHTTTEWGVRSEHHVGDYTSPARSEEHADGMLRGYASYGARADKFARLVLPWQEVKANG